MWLFGKDKQNDKTKKDGRTKDKAKDKKSATSSVSKDTKKVEKKDKKTATTKKTAKNATDTFKTKANPKAKAKPKVIAKSVKISFVDDKGKRLANDFYFKGKIGEKVQAKILPSIKGYKLSSSIDTVPAISDKHQSCKLTYKENKLKLSLLPVNAKGKSIDKKKEIEILADSKIDPTKYLNIKGYKLVNNTYTAKDGDSEIKVVYEPLQAKLHIKYVDHDGNQLRKSTELGKTGEDYKVVPENDIPGYTVDKDQKKLTGTYAPGVNNVEITCTPIESKIVIAYLDERGNSLHEPTTKSGAYHSKYEITKADLPEIKGYNLTSSLTEMKGRFGLETKPFSLRYEKATVEIHIKYWFDEDHTTSVKEDDVLSGYYGDKYGFNVSEINGYVADKTFIEGNYDLETKEYNVVYQKQPAVVTFKLLDELGHPVSEKPIIKEGFFGDSITVALPEIDGYTRPEKALDYVFNDLKNTVVVNYQGKDSKVNVKYIDSKTNKPIFETSLPGIVGTAYNCDPQPFNGFKLVKVPANASGKFTAKEQEVKFLYELIDCEVVVHYYDTAFMFLENKSVKGKFGDKYDIATEYKAGYKFKYASGDLKGTYNRDRIDINLYFEPTKISFNLLPVTAKGEAIGLNSQLIISGLVNQPFSANLPEIPGYIPTTNQISGILKSEYDKKAFNIVYDAEVQHAYISFVYKDGSLAGQFAYPTFDLQGHTGEETTYSVPQVVGYKPSNDKIEVKFDTHEQNFEVEYTVEKINYKIIFNDLNGNQVGTIEDQTGSYGDTIQLDNIPDGYHLPENSLGSFDLTSDTTYIISVEPDEILLNLIGIDDKGNDLKLNRQVSGKFNETGKFEVPQVEGYTTASPTMDVKFTKDNDPIKIEYTPEQHTITISYISISGDTLAPKRVIETAYQEPYSIEAIDIPGKHVLENQKRSGVVGMQDLEFAFVYQDGDNNFDDSVTDLDTLIANNGVAEKPAKADPEQIQVVPANSVNSNIKTTPLASKALKEKNNRNLLI